ncbi:hypothetical protein AHF37_04129 [Paragonimus kellicotti]|nr:hypothetical protein AHF37_04129 [Paragonimus kellicotti]
MLFTSARHSKGSLRLFLFRPEEGWFRITCRTSTSFQDLEQLSASLSNDFLPDHLCVTRSYAHLVTKAACT